MFGFQPSLVLVQNWRDDEGFNHGEKKKLRFGPLFL